MVLYPNNDYAVKFEAGEDNRILHESVCCKVANPSVTRLSLPSGKQCEKIWPFIDNST